MTLPGLRHAIRRSTLAPDRDVLSELKKHAPTPAQRRAATDRAVALVSGIRSDTRPGLMESFLAEFGLSTREGVALMCLAEALFRVPDAETIDALIEDKIAPSDWGSHLGKSSSSLVNASTWALMLTGRVLQDGQGLASVLRAAVRRLGEPVIRTAVARAMKEIGHQFVLGQSIDEAVQRSTANVGAGYTYSYDMLGEAALTQADADGFFEAYRDAITRLGPQCTSPDIRDNPGISIKLSALHPRFELAKKDRVMAELVPRTLALARLACASGMGLNIDAEEADRLDLSLDVIDAVFSDPSLAGWDGFGVVVQAYGKRALPVLDWLYALAAHLDRRLMVRLVKGAYWDSEIKQAQVDGLHGFPVFTRKAATDASYLCCASRLLGMTDRVYPQLATHNAHSVAAILACATDPGVFEFQRLHGMGEVLHDLVRQQEGTRCRIYAPVGTHRDLLAYLVRRLLENGANSSFVNQIVDTSVPAERVAADPFEALAESHESTAVIDPRRLYGPSRTNASGFDLGDPDTVAALSDARSCWKDHVWSAGPTKVQTAATGGAVPRVVMNPAWPTDVVGHVSEATKSDVDQALSNAVPWAELANVRDRAKVLVRASNLFEAHHAEIFALLAREAGKTRSDAIAELREAVDFLRYYATEAGGLTDPPRGRFACISPWNFPLAIFTGQIAAALATGNAVLAKPAETTSLIAALAVRLMHEAGVPHQALQLLPGDGTIVGTALTSAPRVDGVCFTGSTATAQAINRAMAANLAPNAPLIAETGGLNAMIVDSTALPEQAVSDILVSAFQSAGQRCSALRFLYLQSDIADRFQDMLFGAMDQLALGDPWDDATDCGPVISAQAQSEIASYIDDASRAGRLLKQLPVPISGHFVGPAVIQLNSIADLPGEVFGPVLHIATYEASELDTVVDAINAKGFGLTFGMHSRIDDRVDQVIRRVTAGNIYINRNQIGAIVGSQPFGGEGLSGTGPKAGGPSYLHRFVLPGSAELSCNPGKEIEISKLQVKVENASGHGHVTLSQTDLPGPTGESNRLSELGRGVVLCLGPGLKRAEEQAAMAMGSGAAPVIVAPGARGALSVDGICPPDALIDLIGFDAVVVEARKDILRTFRMALAQRTGPLIPLLSERDFARWLRHERHVCVDTTASGGNATLLASAD